MKSKMGFVECNVGRIDRIIRICLVMVLVFLGYFYDKWWLYLIAILLLFTAIFGYCPIYQVFRVNTCSRKEKD